MKHIGLIAVILSWLGLLFLLRKWKGNSSMTFSQHAAQYKSSQLYYLILWLICLPPFYIFMVYQFAPALRMHWSFTAFATLSSLCLVVAAAVPETTGWKNTTHRLSAFTMAYFMFLMTVMIAFSSATVIPARIFAFLSVVSMLCSIVVLNHHKRAHPKMLHIQALYNASFHATVLIAFYTL